jgi:hypothetical protein
MGIKRLGEGMKKVFEAESHIRDIPGEWNSFDFSVRMQGLRVTEFVGLEAARASRSP